MPLWCECAELSQGTPTMDRNEAAAKLKYYEDDYGDWVNTTTPEQARIRAVEHRSEADEAGTPTQRRLKLLAKAVHFESVALCREVLGPAEVVVAPVVEKTVVVGVVSMADFKSRREGKVVSVEIIADGEPEFDIEFIPEGRIDPDIPEFSMDDMDDEIETFSMLDLTVRALKPRFKLGDPAWVVAHDEEDSTWEYVPVTIVGMELYPDEVVYMIGYYDEETGNVETNFETAMDEELFVERPSGPMPVKRGKPTLSVVRNEAQPA